MGLPNFLLFLYFQRLLMGLCRENWSVFWGQKHKSQAMVISSLGRAGSPGVWLPCPSDLCTEEQEMHLHKAELARQADSQRTVLLEIIRPALYRRQQMGKNMSCQPGLRFNSPVLVQACYFSVSDGRGRGISQEAVIGWEWSEKKGRTWFGLA